MMEVSTPAYLTADEASVELRKAIMDAFHRVLSRSPLAPMVILTMAAAGLASTYCEVADAHGRDACPCGWRPDSRADMFALQTALGAVLADREAFDLSNMRPEGRA